MKNWQKNYPPYEGDLPYLYLAFAGADKEKIQKILRSLLERGCRVFYTYGPAGSAEALLSRQDRAAGASITVVYLSEAACADKELKSLLLVNQKFGRKILCLDPDTENRRLSMGLREDLPHLSLSSFSDREELTDAILHADGFSQDLLGAPVRIRSGSFLGKLAAGLCLFAVLLLLVSFADARYFHRFVPEQVSDEVLFTDAVLRDAVREAAGGGAITRAAVNEITFLRLEALPETWKELSLLPGLQRIELPQQALLSGAELPEEDITVVLSGGDRQ